VLSTFWGLFAPKDGGNRKCTHTHTHTRTHREEKYAEAKSKAELRKTKHSGISNYK